MKPAGSAPGEFELIARLSALLGEQRVPGIVGIGDDCAAIPAEKGGYTLLTCDILVEGSHFQRQPQCSLASLGWKALAVNVSDVISCGGKPSFALISLGVPEKVPVTQLETLYQGIAEASAHYDVEVVGGNIARASTFFIDVFLLGHAPRFVGRAGLQDGDLLAISGPTGESAAGRIEAQHPSSNLEKNASPRAIPAFRTHLLRQHERPTPDLRWSDWLALHAPAAMDISDGLAATLHALADINELELVLESERIPLSPALLAHTQGDRQAALELALTGGEDYQLLFGLPEDSSSPPLPHHVIGRVRAFSSNASPSSSERRNHEAGKAAAGRVLLDGRPLGRRGWDHLASG